MIYVLDKTLIIAIERKNSKESSFEVNIIINWAGRSAR